MKNNKKKQGQPKPKPSKRTNKQKEPKQRRTDPISTKKNHKAQKGQGRMKR